MERHKQKERKGLPAHEWAVIVPLAAGIVAAACLSWHSEPDNEELAFSKQEQVRTVNIHLKGAVSRPGIYTVEQGTLLSALLAEAGLYPSADLRKIDLEAPQLKSRTLTIKEREMISITVEGALESPGPRKVARGTRLSEWLMELPLHEDADLSGLQSRRYLKEGEKILIPARKSLNSTPCIPEAAPLQEK